MVPNIPEIELKDLRPFIQGSGVRDYSELGVGSDLVIRRVPMHLPLCKITSGHTSDEVKAYIDSWR